jgi:DNA-binding response OmpR family regulator
LRRDAAILKPIVFHVAEKGAGDDAKHVAFTATPWSISGRSHCSIMATPRKISDPQGIFAHRILVVSGREAEARRCGEILAHGKFAVLTATTAASALDMLAGRNDIAVVLIDRDFGEAGFLERLRDAAGGAEVIVLGEGLAGMECLAWPCRDEELIEAVTAAYNLARMQAFQRDEMQMLEASLLDFRSRTLTAVARMIALAQKAQGRTMPQMPAPGGEALARDAAFQTALREESLRTRLRERLFGAWAASHASWLLVLVIAEARFSRTPATIKGAAYSAGLPLSSALRRMNEMCASAMLEKREDPSDARRTFVRLTPAGLSQLALYLTRAAPERPGVTAARAG